MGLGLGAEDELCALGRSLLCHVASEALDEDMPKFKFGLNAREAGGSSEAGQFEVVEIVDADFGGHDPSWINVHSQGEQRGFREATKVCSRRNNSTMSSKEATNF